mgnify:FL=1|jgi:hypothetical protein|tara:strand:+ start:175 stop:387 length:213 start_codon:yes stop_codon:yes gene_type:complete
MLKIFLNLVETIVPIGGELIENIKAKEGGAGRFFAPRFIKQMIRLLVAAGAVYAFVTGKISIEEVQEVVK